MRGQFKRMLGSLAGALTCIAGTVGGVGTDSVAAGTDSVAAGGEPEPTGEMRFAHQVGPLTWDPHAENRAVIAGWYGFVYDALLATDAAGELVAGLATDWELEADQLELTLRDEVTFHDGSAFDAEAVQANIERAKASPSVGAALSTVDSVEVVDPTHVVLHLSRPTPNLPEELTSFAGLMVSPAVADADLAQGMPAGTGPYVLDADESTGGSTWVFTPADDFWDAELPRFERVEGHVITDDAARLNALAGGQIDVAVAKGDQVDQLESSGFEITRGPAGYASALQIMDLDGTLVPELADERVRRAVAHAIDREAFVQTVLGNLGAPSTQLFAEGALGWVDDYSGFDYDPEAAQELLAEAGVTDLEFTIPSIPVWSRATQVLQGMLAEQGITMNIEPAGEDVVADIGDRNYPAAYTFVATPHPQTTFERQLMPGGIYNPFEVTQPDVDSAESEVLASAGDDEAAGAYADMFRSAYDSAWIIPIAYNDTAIAFNPDTVADVTVWSGVAGSFYPRGPRPA